jgi:hypothetical protein
MTTMKREPLPACLKYAGFLGHEFIVTRFTATGIEDTRAEVSILADATALLGSQATGCIYQRGKRGWHRIMRKAY